MSPALLAVRPTRLKLGEADGNDTRPDTAGARPFDLKFERFVEISVMMLSDDIYVVRKLAQTYASSIDDCKGFTAIEA